MATAETTSALYSARPAFRLDDRDEPGLGDGLLSLMVEETTAGLSRCEATFGNWGTVGGDVDFLYLDRKVLDFGKSLSVRAGDRDTEAQIFAGRITALEAFYPPNRPPEIAVLAEDRFQELRMTRRTRTFEDSSDQDVMERIGSEHGLSTDVDVQGPTYRVLAQVNQSDLAFLRERVRAIDAEIWLEDDTLFAQSRGKRDQGEVTLRFGEGLREFSVMADVATQRTGLTISGWDVAAKEAVEFEATETAIRAELNGDVSGVSILQTAFGERAERIVHRAPFNEQEAKYLAEAHYRSMARRFVTGGGVAEGDGRIRVGARLRLEGVGPSFSGAYYVTEARHLFDPQRGFLTRFCVERPGLKST